MSARSNDLPLASPDTERYAMERVGPVWRDMAPEEWVARNIHQFPLWGWADYRFPTQAFDAWMREAERYVFDLEGRRKLRERYLTEEEIAVAEDYEAGPL
jgi:hypothetical protein